jgi:putative tryptophan/tyrosine transport system substrate-binding protein
MRRRDFIAVLGASTAVWPTTARAQTGISLIGFIGTGSANGTRELVGAFHRGLREMGYIEGQNVKVEYRWAEGEYKKLPVFAAELVQRRVSDRFDRRQPSGTSSQSGDHKNPDHFQHW